MGHETIIARLSTLALSVPHARFAPPAPTAVASRGVAVATRVHRDRRARAWLSAPGSLTARLRQLGEVRVIRLRQGHAALRPRERALLASHHGHVREVLLLVDGRPAVWARSAVSAQAAHGAWRAIRGLGTRPLAELLFTDPAVRRAPLYAAPLRQHGAGASQRRRDWQEASPCALHGVTGAEPPPGWIRWSVFMRRQQPLIVQEAFAPWVLQMALP